MVMSIDVHVNTCNTRRVLTLWYGGVYIWYILTGPIIRMLTKILRSIGKSVKFKQWNT